MKRFFKHLVYGVLYLGIILGVAYGIYGRLTEEPAPSCVDGIKNQDEVEADCSASEEGKCIPCELKNIKIVYGQVKSMPIREGLTALALEISNQSQNYGLASFEYSFDVYSKFSPLVRKIHKSASLYPGESKFLIESGIDINPDEVGKVEFTVYQPAWQKSSDLPARPEVKIIGASPRRDGSSIMVEGSVQNTSNLAIPNLILGALGYREAEIYRAATLEVRNLAPAESRAFTIYLPALPYDDIRVHANILPD